MGGKVLADAVARLRKAVQAGVQRAPDDNRALGRGRSRREGDSGVTLIEMMIVLVIIGIIAAVVVPNVIGRPDEARVTVAKTDIRSIGSALELYRLDNREYPTTQQGLLALAKEPTLSPRPANWAKGGYLPQVPVDPWGHDYVYRSPGENGRYDIISFGADGKPGGDGVDSDLSNADAAR